MELKLFEMFAGYGGASFALQRAGISFECIGYSEIKKSAIQCYEQNHIGIKNYGDCTKINPKELPDFDLLTGGFPCQPFSTNTHSNVRGLKHKDVNLFYEIIKISKIKQPKYIVLENVKGLKGKKMEILFDSMLKELNKIGYNVYWKLLNTRDYGIPQNRERIWIICIRKDIDESMKFQFPDKKELKNDMNSIIDFDIRERPTPKLKKYKLSKMENIKRFGKEMTRYEAILKSPTKKKNSNIMFEILDAPSNTVSRQSDRIYNLKYSPCLTATGKDYLFYKNGQVFCLTPKECFRLMGFKDNEIKLNGLSLNQQYNLIGDGWDINLASQIFKELFKK